MVGICIIKKELAGQKIIDEKQVGVQKNLIEKKGKNKCCNLITLSAPHSVMSFFTRETFGNSNQKVLQQLFKENFYDSV